MVEQALVDVPDLLDIQGAKREAPPLGWASSRHFHLQELQGFQQMQHGPVVDRQGFGRRLLPEGVSSAALQEGIAVRVEKMTSIGRKAHILVLNAAVDDAEDGEQAAPG